MPKIYLGWENYRPYEFDVPNLPSEKEILGFDIRKKDDQIWQRPKMPDFNKITAREAAEFIEREHYRCKYGVWFMNNGEPTYITGMHYEHLVHNKFPKFKTPTKHPEYYDAQREDFYFRQILMTDPRCLGGIWVKGRRYGLTAEEITNHIYIATHEFDQTCNMISQDEKKAIKTLYKPALYVLRNREAFMRPDYYAPTGKEPATKIEFFTKKIGDTTIQLGSTIIPLPTLTHILDGETVEYATADEVFKWRKCDPYVFHGVTKETLTVGLGKRGIINYTSTVGDDDKVNAVSIAAGAKLWDESDATVLNEYGQTTSGLYKWFIAANKALEGFVDKHGMPMLQQATDFVMSKRAGHEEGSPDWLGVVRRFPLFESEVWNTVQVSKVFDTARLNSQIQIIRKSDFDKDFGHIKGNIINDHHSNKRYFTPTPSGLWELNGLPNPKSTNRFIITREGYQLPDDREYAMGTDTIRYSKTSSKHLSKTAGVILKKQMFDWKNGTDIVLPDFKIAGIYNHRSEVKEDDYWNMVNAALFFSAKIGTERQISNFVEDFITPNNFDGLLTIDTGNGLPGIWTTPKTTEEGLGLIQSLFLRRPRKNSDIVEQTLDYLVKCGFEKLLIQLREFDPKKTTEFDLVMALIMAFFEYIQMSTVRQPAMNKAVNDAMAALFPSRN